jgi:hypothetical protein
MGRLLSAAVLLAAVGAAGTAAAADTQAFDFSADLRAVGVDAPDSFVYRGSGRLRFDDTHSGLRFGSARVGYRGSVGGLVHVAFESVAYGDGNFYAFDLTEAWAELRPYPHSIWRSRLKAGAFYPPISLENRMRGWRSPYSLSPSAINTWVGEELRTLGAEYNLDWLGHQAGHDFDLTLTAAAYGWNDPAGVVVARRGWALHDRQTTLFGKVGERGGLLDQRRLFYEIDHRPGFYAGLTGSFRGKLELRALRYDNRADPAVEAPTIPDYAWWTWFNSYGLRWEPDEHWTLIVQRLQGRTYAGDEQPTNCFVFGAAFGLLSYAHGSQRVSLRHDRFTMQQTASSYGFYNHDRGHAWTAAWQYTLDSHWSLAAEALSIRGELAARTWLGVPPAQTERQLQFALRYER